jgi:hypothetical protein
MDDAVKQAAASISVRDAAVLEAGAYTRPPSQLNLSRSSQKVNPKHPLIPPDTS